MDSAKVIDLLIKNPMSVFIILSVAFGYLYWEKDQKHDEVLTELGGLRAEQQKMSEIIKLQVQLAKAECN